MLGSIWRQVLAPLNPFFAFWVADFGSCAGVTLGSLSSRACGSEILPACTSARLWSFLYLGIRIILPRIHVTGKPIGMEATFLVRLHETGRHLYVTIWGAETGPFLK
jgi:hypothetical protein